MGKALNAETGRWQACACQPKERALLPGHCPTFVNARVHAQETAREVMPSDQPF